VKVVVHDYSGHPGQVHLSRELARRGHVVEHQFCASYTTGRGATDRRHDDPQTFSVRALTLSTEFKRYNPVIRVAQEFQYAWVAARALLAAHPDVVVLSNIPLLGMLPVTWALRLRRVPYVHWWQDVYSDAINTVARRRLGWAGVLVGSLAQQIERHIVRRAAKVVAIADAFLEQLDQWQIDRNHARVIPNWGAIDEMPVRARDNAWAQAHELADAPVVMYSGTLGLKHDPSVIAKLAENAPDGTRVVVVSQGLGREWLEAEKLRASGASAALMLLDYQPYEQLPDMLASADVLFVVLESDASRYSVPSKVLNYLCAGRPVLALLPPDNAVAEMVTAAGAGVVVDPKDAEATAAEVARLLGDAGARERMGAAARRYAEDTFDVGRIGDLFESVLIDVYDRKARFEQTRKPGGGKLDASQARSTGSE
jgi:colanic acid biosynthesis glycosyl transferase WcaI